MKKTNKRTLGWIGEQLAVEYLRKSGYRILERNYRFGRAGEIDIIVEKDGTVCFVEVKSRTSLLYGSPSEAVDIRKQMHIKKAAAAYIHSHGLYDSDISFDCIEVLLDGDSHGYAEREINLLKNVF